jgi:NhaB family Na+:H+ antiporter
MPLAKIFTAFSQNFLGNSPSWYKLTIIGFLIVNPIALYLLGPFVTGWFLILQFIFTLALALKCYPLQPGGLLALQAVLLGMTDANSVVHEIEANSEVLFLLLFMVAGIYFMQSMLLFVFTKLLINVRSKLVLSLLFSLSAALLSAFLDALTVTAVLISVGLGFYSVYHKVVSGHKPDKQSHDFSTDMNLSENHREELVKFRAFLQSIVMHGVVGTALGGVCTTVGEPQNLLIAGAAGWGFVEFFLKMAPVTMPVLVAGLVTCTLLEVSGFFGYGQKLPENVRKILSDHDKENDKKMTGEDKSSLAAQGLVAFFLVICLAFQVAPVGLIGLGVIIILTSLNGIVRGPKIGKAFGEALPFTALLVVFFAIVSVIHSQHLFSPVTNLVLSQDLSQQPLLMFVANGFLSMISDNVFVATVYVNEIQNALSSGDITRDHFEKLTIAINTGTNIPSVATPNGQAAFLFLLTSTLSPLIRLSYGRMIFMALPYTIVMSIVGMIALNFYLT